MRERAIVFWSGGKDCALALEAVRGELGIVALVTTVTGAYDRISMHGVRRELLVRQAEVLGLPVVTIEISVGCTNDEYERKTRAVLESYVAAGVTATVCGDLFLEDVRKYREERLLPQGLRGVFPLWNRPTAELAREFIARGYRAVLCCVDTQALDGGFAGRPFDEALLADLPATVDPCGENGEFHTFVTDGPGFSSPVGYTLGERTMREERFAFCDLVPAASPIVETIAG